MTLDVVFLPPPVFGLQTNRSFKVLIFLCNAIRSGYSLHEQKSRFLTKPPSRRRTVQSRNETRSHDEKADLDDVVVSVFSVHGLHCADVEAPKHFSAGVHPPSISGTQWAQEQIRCGAESPVASGDAESGGAGGRGCGSQSCADEFTCQSWRSVPAWQNRCWPSSSQKWTSSCKCIKKKKKDRRSRFCSSLRILAGAALISAMTAAIHTYTMFTQCHVFGGEAGGNQMR